MADTFSWTLSELVTRFRSHVGISNATDLTDATIHKWINDYYQNYFPDEAYVDLLRGTFTQSTGITDNGEYSLAQTVLNLKKPILCNGEGIENEIELNLDAESFFRKWAISEQYVTEPSLAIGVSDVKKVKHSAFTYDISGYSYSKASSEVSLSGLSTIPQNKYGAFSFKIDSDGTITAAEADDNSTGYDTPTKAVEGLADPDGNSAYMGYVVVISTDAGGFVPNSTDLSDSAVTDYYIDGRPDLRQRPEEACIFKGYLYVRPKADDIYRISCPYLKRPSAIDTSEAPLDIQWGPAIACGAAIMYANIVMKDLDKVKELTPMHRYLMNKVSGKRRKQLTEMVVERSMF